MAGEGLASVAAGLDVDFLVLPSVSTVAGSVELTLQLIDGGGAPVWALSSALPCPCPRDLLRREASRFAAEIAGMRGEVVRLVRRWRAIPDLEEGSGDAYALFLAAGAHFEAAGRTHAERAVALAERSVALDPHFARAWLMLAWCRHFRASGGFAPHGSPSEEAALFRRATEVAPRDGLGFAYLALGRAKQGAQAEAERLVDHAASLAEASADVAAETTLGLVTVAGQARRALRLMDEALARCPDPPPAWRYMEARAAWFAGLPERALLATGHAPEWIPTLVMRALAAAELGDDAEALLAWRRLRRVAPVFDLGQYERELPITHPAALERYRAGVRRLAAVLAAA